MKNYKWIIIIFILFIGMVTVPYILALVFAGDQYVFSGFLYNPQDGNSYLAKMYEGWGGNWRFVLPYTSEPGYGAYLFLFYITLGHIARLTGTSLIFIFHLSRVLCSIAMAAAIYQLLNKFQNHFPDIKLEKIFGLVLFGSGMGWLLIAAGITTSDFLLAEAYPFLSGFSNPHFPLGIALIVWSLLRWDRDGVKNAFCLLIMGMLIAIIMPFGVAILAAIGGVKILWEGLRDKKFLGQPVFYNVTGGGVLLLYQFVVIQVDPVLSEWNKQNITLTPSWWNLLISFSPILICCLIGAVYLIFSKNILKDKIQPFKIPVIWVLITLLLIFFPFNLQRRFLTGIYIPLTVICAGFVSSIKNILWKKRIWNVILGLSLVSNLIIIAMTMMGIVSKNEFYYYSRDEEKAFQWISQNTERDALILASPQTGLLIPAHTGRRVIYGHPYETIHAAENEKMVTELFTGNCEKQKIFQYVKDNQIKFIFVGPQEKKYGNNPFVDQYPVVYQADNVVIYSVNE